MSDTPTALWGIRRTARELVDGTIRVQIDIDPKNRRTFNELLGEIDMPVALAPLNPNAVGGTGRATTLTEPNSGERTLAQKLHIDGYFNGRFLWQALHEHGVYTLQDHKAWIESQDCAMRGVLNTPCHGDVVLHHCTSAGIAAAGAKLQPENPNKVPHWYGVPLCHEHHRNWLHQGVATREEKDMLLRLAVRLIAEQSKRAMKRYMGLESLKDIDQDMLNDFERELGIGIV